jgi:menaquinone-dependent protoporphyrinogen oxidase
MSNILILYGSSHGQTAKIARFIGESLCAGGADVRIVDALTETAEADSYDAVIVAASVHAGGYQKAVAKWVSIHRESLNHRPTAFVSVCLGVLERDPAVQRSVAAILDRFLEQAGWRPTMTKSVAGALLYTRYNWLMRLIMKRMAAKAGGDTDTRRDYEYTDWKDVEAFARDFQHVVARDASPVVQPSRVPALV